MWLTMPVTPHVRDETLILVTTYMLTTSAGVNWYTACENKGRVTGGIRPGEHCVTLTLHEILNFFSHRRQFPA